MIWRSFLSAVCQQVQTSDLKISVLHWCVYVKKRLTLQICRWPMSDLEVKLLSKPEFLLHFSMLELARISTLPWDKQSRRLNKSVGLSCFLKSTPRLSLWQFWSFGTVASHGLHISLSVPLQFFVLAPWQALAPIVQDFKDGIVEVQIFSQLDKMS